MFRDGAEKLTKSSETHCIGPQRRNVGLSLLKDAQKLKFRIWRDKLLGNVGDEPCDLASEEEEDKDDEVNGRKTVELKKDVANPTPVSGKFYQLSMLLVLAITKLNE